MYDITLECRYSEGMKAWEVRVKDKAGNEIEYTEYSDEEFEEEVRELKKAYEIKRNTVGIIK